MCDFYFVYFLLRFLLFHICPLSRTYPVITCCHPKGILSFGTLFSFSFCALLLTLHSCLEASATALYFRLVDGRIRINMSPPSNILWLVVLRLLTESTYQKVGSLDFPPSSPSAISIALFIWRYSIGSSFHVAALSKGLAMALGALGRSAQTQMLTQLIGFWAGNNSRWVIFWERLVIFYDNIVFLIFLENAESFCVRLWTARVDSGVLLLLLNIHLRPDNFELRPKKKCFSISL